MISVRELADTGIIVIEPGEYLNLRTAHELLRAVMAIPTTIAPAVIINMEKTRMVDSSGVGALVNSMKHIKNASGSFVVTDLQPDVQRTFHMMNLNQVFDIFENQTLASKQMIAQRS